jgi:solute carrier family 25 carnitine/acylcarnitine transporter 20/29
VSIQFSGMEAAKRFFKARKNGAELGLGELWMSGAFAGTVNTVVANPVEHIRIRKSSIGVASATFSSSPILRIGLQTQPTPRIYAGPLDCVSKLYQNGGLAQIFRAQVPCMLRDGIGMGCYFLTYEALVQRHLKVNGGERGDISPLYAVGYGAAAGYGLWFRYVQFLFLLPPYLKRSLLCSSQAKAKEGRSSQRRGDPHFARSALIYSIYPIDVIKSKIQTDALDPSKRQYTGMIDCARRTLAREGWRGFTGGLGPTLIRSPFANGATFVAFEMAMRAMA